MGFFMFSKNKSLAKRALEGFKIQRTVEPKLKKLFDNETKESLNERFAKAMLQVQHVK